MPMPGHVSEIRSRVFIAVCNLEFSWLVSPSIPIDALANGLIRHCVWNYKLLWLEMFAIELKLYDTLQLSWAAIG